MIILLMCFCHFFNYIKFTQKKCKLRLYANKCFLVCYIRNNESSKRYTTWRGWLSCTSCNRFEKSIGRSYVKREGRTIVVNFGLDINNPAPSFATVNRTFGNIQDANGNILGRFNVPTYRIDANGTTRINIPIRIEAFGSLQAVLSSILNKNAKVAINYTNEVGLLSVSDTYSFDLKEALNFPAVKNLTNRKQVKTNPATKTV